MTRTYLALGDSYTIGEGVAENGRWPMQLAQVLRDDGFDIAQPRIIATTGWTTDELSAAIDAAEPLGKYDLVSLLIGVNNQYRGRSVAEYREQFATLLARAIAAAGDRAQRAFVLSIPDWGVTPFAAQQQRDVARIAAEIDAFNAAANEICNANGVAFIDITAVSRQRGFDAEMLADDGLHPSAAMYARWATLALPVVKALLAKD
ncbi:MAG: SGNH/GDSL hydrolase family protein [Pseudoxanthomonas sp.]